MNAIEYISGACSVAIPKVIHQTVRTKTGMHPSFAKGMDILKKLNPGWEYRLYDDRDVYEFIGDTFEPNVLRLYESINPSYGAAKADFFRYLAIYENGGVYLDIKSAATLPLDCVLKEEDEYILSHWANGKGEPYEGWGIFPALGPRGEYQQWHLIASAKHPFLDAVIDRVQEHIRDYQPNRDGVGKMAVMRVTGPIAYSCAIADVLNRAPFRLVDIRQLGFEYSIFGASLEHEKYFENHYRHLSGPLITSLRRNSPCPCGSMERYKNCHGRLPGTS